MSTKTVLANIGLLLLLVACTLLFYLYQTRVPAAVMPGLDSSDDRTRAEAAERLREMAPRARQAGPRLFVLATSDSYPPAASAAAYALGVIDLEKSRQAIAILLPQLDSPDQSVRGYAVDKLAALGAVAKPAVPRLLKLLEDPDVSLRRRVISSLGRIGLPAAAIKHAIEKTQASDSDATVRNEAKSVLDFEMRMVPVDVYIYELGQNHSPQQVWPDAMKHLALAGPAAAPAVPALIEKLSDDYELVRYMAAEALGAIGPQAKSAVPALTARLNDSSAVVRTSAEEALRSITQDEKGGAR